MGSGKNEQKNWLEQRVSIGGNIKVYRVNWGYFKDNIDWQHSYQAKEFIYWVNIHT